MGIFGWILLGLFVGTISRALVPGRTEPGGCIGTTAIGILGALIGGLIASALDLGEIKRLLRPRDLADRDRRLGPPAAARARDLGAAAGLADRRGPASRPLITPVRAAECYRYLVAPRWGAMKRC